MSYQEIRDKKGSLTGTIHDVSSGGSGDFEPWQKWFAVITAIFGALVGFSEAGIGGAIVGIVLGPIVALLICGAIWWCAIIGFFIGIFWLIAKLWGVGL